MHINLTSPCQNWKEIKFDSTLKRQFYFDNRMKEAVKLQHFNQYRKLSVYNLIVEIEGFQDLEQININKVILSDSNDRANNISFLNYV